MTLRVKVGSNFDEATNDKFRACTKAEFPLCLDGALQIILGEDGRDALDSILTKSGFAKPSVSSPEEVLSAYEMYFAAYANELGKGAAAVIQFHATKKMESMRCTKCPLYKAKLEEGVSVAPVCSVED